MKTTGITRKIDELGRIVIPKEIRKNLGIRDGETLEIYLDSDSIILKKFNEMENYTNLCSKLVDIVHGIYDVDVIITDREKIVSSSINGLVGVKLDNYLVELIDNRESFKEDKFVSFKFGDIELSGYYVMVPIIASSDSLGLVIIKSIECGSDNLAKFVACVIKEKIDV